MVFLPGRQFFEPATSRGIVVGAGVHDSIGRIVVRQVGVIQFAVECELEHAHSRQSELVTQRAYIGRDQPQILGDEWQNS